MGGLRTQITRFWLSIAIGITVLLALLFPEPGQHLPETFILDIVVIIVFFFGSLKINPKLFVSSGRQFHLIGASLFSLFVVAPALSMALAHGVGFGDLESKSAVLICSSAATTVATGFVLTEVAGGNSALAILIAAVSNLLAVLIIPVIFQIAVSSQVELDALEMLQGLSGKVLLPLLFGQIARIGIKKWVARHGKKLSLFNQVAILLFVYSGVTASAPLIAEQGFSLIIKLVIFVAVFHISLLVFNGILAHFLARDAATRSAFVLSSSQKNLSVSILVWKDHFTHLYFGPLVAVAYHMFQLIVDSIMAPSLKQYPLIRETNTAVGEEGQNGIVRRG